MKELGFVDVFFRAHRVLFEKEGKFVGSVDAMARRKIMIQRWSNQPIGNILCADQGKEKDKRKILVFKESERELKNFIKKGKHENNKPK